MPRLARKSSVILALALALAVIGCGGMQVSTVLSRIGDGPSIAANELTFDRSEIVVPADRAFGLLFDNQESVPHNVAVYVDESAGQALFVGEIFSGPGSRLYELPAFPAGSYFFRSDIHPEMKGTLVAKP